MSALLDTRRWRSWAVLAFVGTLAACAEDAPLNAPGEAAALPEEVRDAQAPRLSTVQNSEPKLALCGTTTRYILWAGKYFPGTVTVANDADNLFVTYSVDSRQTDWYVSDTRVSVTRNITSIPLDRNRLPNPWAFPFSASHSPVVKTHTYAIPMASNGWKTGDRLVVAAMAGMVHPTTRNVEGPWEWLVAWGLGDVSGRTVESLANYTVQKCPNAPTPPPPPATTTGAISITFDDGWEDTYTRAFPVLSEYKLVANAAVNPMPIDSLWGYYMRLSQVKALADAGWTIVSHTMTHRELTLISDADLETELSESQKWIVKQGFTRGSHIFVVPFHLWGDRERAAVKRYYKAARGYSANQFSPIRMVKYPVPEASRYDITAFEPEFAPFTTAEGRALTRTYLDRAVKNGEYVDILFHHIEEKDLPAFREMVAILAEYKPYIRTYDQIIPK